MYYALSFPPLAFGVLRWALVTTKLYCCHFTFVLPCHLQTVISRRFII